MLPVRLESFVNYTLNDKNEYILDVSLLKSAGEDMQTALSERILYIASSDRKTILMPVSTTTDLQRI